MLAFALALLQAADAAQKPVTELPPLVPDAQAGVPATPARGEAVLMACPRLST